MNTEQILKVLKNERECIKRQGDIQKCDRRCGECDLCLPEDEILAVYDFLIGGYELIQKEGAEDYSIRCDISKLSDTELEAFKNELRNLKAEAISEESCLCFKSLPDNFTAIIKGDTD